MLGLTLECGALNSEGKEANGFYKNIEKFDKWQEKYKFCSGVKELFYELNNRGICFSYDHSRIHEVASILYTEGYAYTLPKAEKIVKISRDNFVEEEAMFVDLFKCPNCKDNEVMEDHKYCPNCGVKLQWVARKEGDQ